MRLRGGAPPSERVGGEGEGEVGEEREIEGSPRLSEAEFMERISRLSRAELMEGCFGPPSTPGSPQGRGSVLSVGDGPETPLGDSEQGWEDGRAYWEENLGWDVETQDCTSTQDGSSQGDPREELDNTPGPNSAHFPFFTEEYSAMVLWDRSRGLLMEKVLGKYRFVGGVNEPFLFEGRVGNLECDTRPMERVIGAVEIIAGRQIGPLCMLGRFAMRHFVVESWKGGGGRSGFAFRSREGQLAWVKPDWIGGDIGIDDLWVSSAFVWGEVYQFTSHSSGSRHIPL